MATVILGDGGQGADADRREMRDALIIHNPLAGRARTSRPRKLEEARRILAGAGIETELQATTESGNARALAQQAADQGRELIIVCGGDGTLNEVVNGLAATPNGCQVPLALLPAGTANVLAKELGLPWDIVRAAALVLGSAPRRIALGCCTSRRETGEQRYFLCVAGAGADGAIIHHLNPTLKLSTGIGAYWLEGARLVFRYPFPMFRIVSEGQSIEASLIVVGRTQHYGGPFRITTEASLFRDEFEMMAVTTRKALRYLLYFPALWLGKLRGLDGVQFWKSAAVRCEPLGNEPIFAQVDGEPAGQLPVEFTIVPNALTLLVPETPGTRRHV